MLKNKKECADLYCVTFIELQAYCDAFIQNMFRFSLKKPSSRLIKYVKLDYHINTIKCLFFKYLKPKHSKQHICFNPSTPNDPYRGRTAPLTSKVAYIYSTNIGTEYFKHGIYSPFFPLQNAVCFIILTYLVPVLFTFYIQGVLKLKEIIPAPKG